MIDMSRFDWFDEPVAVSEEVLDDLEKTLARKFPADYRWFAQRFACGAPENLTDFRFVDGNGVEFTGGVGTFLSPDPASEEAILRHLEVLVERGVVGLLPVADTGGGDYVCLDWRTESVSPPVVYWHHGRQGLGDEVSAVAGSFSEFIPMLFEPDLEAEEALD